MDHRQSFLPFFSYLNAIENVWDIARGLSNVKGAVLAVVMDIHSRFSKPGYPISVQLLGFSQSFVEIQERLSMFLFFIQHLLYPPIWLFGF
jgi:hypothetical protein